MNKEQIIQQFYLTINSKVEDDCYERQIEYKNSYTYPIADENIISDNGEVTAICYEDLTWTLDEVGVQKTFRESMHPNGMHSIYRTEYVTLEKQDIKRNKDD